MGVTEEYDKNQLTAWKSWNLVASAIILFNDVQPELQSNITRFIPSEPFPKLMDIYEVAAHQNDFVAILNADIVVMPQFVNVERKLKARKAIACSSWRWQFTPPDTSKIEVVDPGLDFFAATPEVWGQCYNDVEETLRLGSVQWDSWQLGWFCAKAAKGFLDITPTRTILHPKHGNRQYGPPPPQPPHFHAWPTMSPVSIRL